MQQTDLNEKTRALAERAAINELKQKILFEWHRDQRPIRHKIYTDGSNRFVYLKATQELNEQYPSCLFSLFWVD